MSYHQPGDCPRAIADFNMAIEIDPKYADAYNGHGQTFDKLGGNNRAIADLKIAAQFGNQGAQGILRFKGIPW